MHVALALLRVVCDFLALYHKLLSGSVSLTLVILISASSHAPATLPSFQDAERDICKFLAEEEPTYIFTALAQAVMRRENSLVLHLRRSSQ